MVSFQELGLKKEIVAVLDIKKFAHPLEVQEQIIPLATKGKNIVFTSRTGSGKTLAYLLGFIGRINKKIGLQMLVLVPTRELCIQVGKEIKNICDPLSINVGVLYGGRDFNRDYQTTAKKNSIIVGTPGRLIQHINEKNVRVGDVTYLVYDESDQMFDQGFYDECVYLKTRVCKNAQIILSSATITDKVHSFIENEIGDFELLQIGDLVPKSITQEKIFCEKSEKLKLMLDLFAKRRFRSAMVFSNTKIRCSDIFECLSKNNIKSRVLNASLEQKDRLNTLNLFKDGKIPVLVTTDVAARGLHIENIDIVLNYDIPTRPEFYVHRIGRAGRRDKAGYAISFICPEDVHRFEEIEKIYNQKVGLLNKNLEKD